MKGRFIGGLHNEKKPFRKKDEREKKKDEEKKRRKEKSIYLNLIYFNRV